MNEIDNIYVYFVNMDTYIPEQIAKNRDGTYTILLNARLTYESNMQSYKHAVAHIVNGDFDEENADIIECKRHNLALSKELCYA